MTTETGSQPLEGVRVLDLGQIYSGGYAGFLLAQAGADVVKVEPPRGENLRNRPKVHGAEYPFLALNVNKRSVSLDLKTSHGRDRFLDLVAVADVVLENFSPGVMDRLDLAFPVLQSINPRIVYASSTGYGLGGRYQDLPAMDLTVQAMVGVLSVTGFPESPPVKAGVAIADFMAGVHMYAGIVTALFNRERAGRGARVDVSMFDATLPATLSSLAMALGTQNENPTRTGNRHGGLAEAPYNVFSTIDGHVAIICVSEHQWVALTDVMGRPELADDERFTSRAARVENIDVLDEAIAAWTSARTRQTVVDLLLDRGIPVAPVRTLREVVDDPDMEARGVLRPLVDAAHGRIRVLSSPIRYDGGESVSPRPAPGLGEHDEEVFDEWLGSRAGVSVGTTEGV